MENVVDVHRYLAYSIPAGFALMTLWAIYAFVRNREPGEWFWRLLAVVQVVLGVEVLIGITLFVSGRRPPSNGPSWLHYVYGGFGPILVLVVAHRWARKNEGLAWVVFGAAAFVSFGLTFRAIQTGLGID